MSITDDPTSIEWQASPLIKLSTAAYQDMCTEISTLKKDKEELDALYHATEASREPLKREILSLRVRVIELEEQLKQERSKRLRFKTIPE